ncbi:MAG TPA: UvrD-helicase domain-containing protein, partial [Candidatus Acidoferrum sp.]|nr:UvrD-helicase domain-containing protein [Candidatus Acidoferrum sp.]
TESQLAAINADGDVLVTAGAGAGKTSTLVARCVRRLLDPQYHAGLNEILMVTFTDAAAAEMRKRIREALEAELARDGSDMARIEEQLALLDTANISTLHSFCYRLVRQHFYELGIDPELMLLDEAQGAALMDETLDELFKAHYTSRSELGEAVQRLIQNHAGGREQPIRELVLKLHHYTQTQVNPGRWLDEQLAMFQQPEPTQWRAWLLEALKTFCVEWPEVLREQSDNPIAQQLAAEIEKVANGRSIDVFAPMLEAIPESSALKPKQRPPKEFFSEARFLRSLVVKRDGIDPLVQDWDWVRGDMATLLALTQEFARLFGAAKREQGALDFHDLEQFALRLLQDQNTGEPTLLARDYQQQFRFVFVDECQDVNAAQDAIIRSIAECGMRDAESNPNPHSVRHSRPGNRFLVGDVKQSIYRFRLADPQIFQRYSNEWKRADSGARVLSLSENFRSREGLLDFFNAVFAELMDEEIGRVPFDEESKLQFGAREKRSALARKSGDPRVHLHLRIPSREEVTSNGDGDDAAELSGAEHEARIVAHALHELRASGHVIATKEGERGVEWHDMAVLLRAPSGKQDIYAREFARQGIPLQVAQADFFSTLEVADLLNALAILDNPLQDVPLIAVLHSPLVGLNEDELAEVRLANRDGGFWSAVNRFHETQRSSSTWSRIDLFLSRFSKWRRMARDSALSDRLQAILTGTHYLDWLVAHAANNARAEQCVANVRRLLGLAEQFDPFQRHGLPRFLKFVEAQQRVASKEPLAASGNAVQVISIHRSKGLEYPVVVLPDLGKRFNMADLEANVLLDRRYGLCARIKPPQTGRRYPSLPHWLSGKHERAELLGEEMRLLYVAMTRARDTLLLVGTATPNRVEEWAGTGSSSRELLAASSMLAWLGPWFARHAGSPDWFKADGQNQLFSWRIHDAETAAPAGTLNVINDVPPFALPPDIETVCTAAAREYPFQLATMETAKTSVSALRRKLSQADEEARPWLRRTIATKREGELSAAEIGTAHHVFLEYAELSALHNGDSVYTEAQRLVTHGVLRREEAQALNTEALADFWAGEVGRSIASHAAHVSREMPFTARFEAKELRELGLATAPAPADEFVIVQGVVDLAVILREEIWLLDFKTDDILQREVSERLERYQPQVRAYAAALERIFNRPVTRMWLHFLALGKTIEV